MLKKRTELTTTKKRQIGEYLLWYSLLFALVSAGVFCWFLKNHRSFCWTVDAISQYIPKVHYFITSMKEMLRNLLDGELAFRMYDFHIGMGDSVPLHTEPIYWLYLLFDESHVEIAYGILILLRFYLAGLSFSGFLWYFQYSRWQSLIGSMVYVFSGYGLYAGMRHSHFIIPMITLPLLLLAMEEIYRKKRWYLCTVFVALSLWCGYYFTYMNTIVMGVYFLIRFFLGEEKKGIKEFCLRMRTIICSYLLGIGIANITFFNTFANYLTSSRTGVSTERSFPLWSYGQNWVSDFYESFLTTAKNPGNWLLLGFIPISYLCIVILFSRKGNREMKAAFLTGTVFCMIPAFGLVFSGFGSLNNRWCYAYAFVVAVITARMVKELPHLTRKECIIAGVSVIPYLYYGIGKAVLHQSWDQSVAIAGVTLVISYIIILILNYWKKISQRTPYAVLTMLCVLLLWQSGTFRFCGLFADMAGEFTKSGKVLEKATDTPLKVMDEIEDPEFYRSYSRRTRSDVQGASMILGFNGVVYYSSTLGKPMIDFYREMGLTSWSLVRARGFDSRGYLDSLACVKYMVLPEEKTSVLPYGYELVKEAQDENNIYENKNALPLGYCYDNVISADEMDQVEDTAAKQEVMLQAAVVDTVTEGEQAYQTDISKVEISGKEIPISNITFDGNISFDGKEIKVKEKDASITFEFDGLEEAETYLNLESLSCKSDAAFSFYVNSNNEVNKITYYYHGDYNTYTTKQEDYLFNLGYSEDAKTFCTIRFERSCTLSVDDISIYCQPMKNLDQYAADRKETVLENVKEEMNKISGTIENKKDQLLVLSIPYQNGWSAYVDGKKVSLQKVNYMYMGLDLKAGNHTIELKYELPGIRISIMITVISIAIFVAALYIRRRGHAKNN